MPMLCELTTVLQYIVAIAESMALPPSNITFLGAGQFKGFYIRRIHIPALVYPCSAATYFPIFAQGMESTETAAYW